MGKILLLAGSARGAVVGRVAGRAQVFLGVAQVFRAGRLPGAAIRYRMRVGVLK